MANPYDGLWSDVQGGASSTADNPYTGLWTQPAGLALFDEQQAELRKKRAELARIAAQGDVGRVPTPDTSIGAISKEAVKMVGASLMENAASAPGQAEALESLPENLIRRAVGMSPLRSPMERGQYGDFKGAVDKIYGDQVQNLATATQDLHPALASALYLGTELGGQALEPTAAGAGMVLRAPHPEAPLPAAVAEREAALSAPISARETEAAAARGVPAAYPGFGTDRDATAFGAWLDRAGLTPQDATPALQEKFFEVHNPEPALVRPAEPSPDLRAAFPDAQIDSRDVYEGQSAWGREVPGDPSTLAASSKFNPASYHLGYWPPVHVETPPPGLPAPTINGAMSPDALPLPRLGNGIDPSQIEDAWSVVSRRYPRLAATITSVRSFPEIPPAGNKFTQAISKAAVDGRGTLYVHPGLGRLSPEDLVHELTHQAQFERGGTNFLGGPSLGMEPGLAEGYAEKAEAGFRGVNPLPPGKNYGDFTNQGLLEEARSVAEDLRLAPNSVHAQAAASRLVDEASQRELRYTARDGFQAAVQRAVGGQGKLPPWLTIESPEAGFVRNPWAPESDTYRQAYQIRHDFVTDQNAAVRESAVRSKALQAAIPDRATREDMTAVFHGTGNPLVKGDTAQAAADRLAASPHAADAQAAVDAWRQRSDELFQMAKDAGADDLGYFKNYLHMVYEAPKGEQTVGGKLAFGEGPTTSVMKERAFDTPAEAMARGYTPRSLDFSVLMHETERAHAHTRALLGLMDDIAGVNERAAAGGIGDAPVVRAAFNPDPKIYVKPTPGKFAILERAAPGRVDPEAVQMATKLQSEAEATNRAVMQGERVQPSLPGLEGLGPQRVDAPGIPETPPNIYVHKDLWRNLYPILQTDDVTGFDKALSVVKRVNFLGSLFHGASLTEAAMDTLGPMRGLKEGAKRGFGIPVVSQIAARLGGGKISEDAVQEAIRAGVNVEPPKLDMMKGTFEGMLQQWEGSLKTGASPLSPRNAVAKALAGFRGAAGMYDEALWANYHAPLKVTAYHVLLDRVRNSPSRAVARDLASGALTQDELAQSVARHVNSAFGGQNWQLLQNDFFSNPKAMRWMRRVILSPDWNYSAIDTGLSPLSADPVRRQLGRTYYKNAAKLMIGWQALNYALSGHAMWDNEPGHKFDLETGLHDDKGRKLFYQVSKHAGETPDFLLGRDKAGQHTLPVVGSVPDFLLRKANSPLVGAYTAMSGRSPTGFPGALERAQDDADRQARPLSGAEVSMARGRDLLGGVLPFVAQDPESTGRKMLIPFVEKKGMSLHDGRILFAEALRDSDQRRVEQIRQWLVDNGYDGEQINRAMAGAYSGMRAEQKAGTPPPAPAAPKSSNPYDGLW